MQGDGVVYETDIEGTLQALKGKIKNILGSGLSLSNLMVQVLCWRVVWNTKALYSYRKI